ncbi:MAG: hemolysin III family protein [Rhodothermales bacterium]|nr:hemolysin III family protein [Rhodothermales bacterium]
MPRPAPMPLSRRRLRAMAQARVFVARQQVRLRRQQTRLREQRARLREEVASAVTHGVGLVLAVGSAPVLVVLGGLRGGALHATSFAVYGTALVLCYAASTLYHAFQQPRLKHLFRVLDHAAIYLLIAGTYTPVAVLSLEGPWGWGLLTAVWAIAVVGCVFKLFFVDRFRGLSTVGYLVMGWLMVVALEEIIASVPAAAFAWLVVGGLFYTAGVVFFVWERLPYNHAVWHLFVIAGSASHYVALLIYVL